MNSSSKLVIKSDYLGLILPFWQKKNNWVAWAIACFILFNMFGITGIYVLSNKISGELVDALISLKWPVIWPVLTLLLFISILRVGLSAIGAALSEYLRLKWRSWMTEQFLGKWMKSHAFYSIERDNSIDNADQRIAQDINEFVGATINIVTMLIGTTTQLISFTIVLWSLSGVINIALGKIGFNISGYLVYIAYSFALLGLLITHLTGFRLIKLQNERQSREADFRYSNMQVRENAEQIAFYDGGKREQQRIHARYKDLNENWIKIILTSSNMMFWRDGYFTFDTIISTLAALPRYLSGVITLGQLTQVSGAFNMVVNAMATYSQAYQAFTSWLAFANRLLALSKVIDAAEATTVYDGDNDGNNYIRLIEKNNNGLLINELILHLPNNKILSKIENVHLKLGERWLFRGQTGVGKSTLLRAIAGIWPYGQGVIEFNKKATKLFLPQRSYIPEGRLLDAICYPSTINNFSKEDVANALSVVFLDHLNDKLDLIDRWQQRLSGGEQQRLALARALLHRPDFLFLDEATSALDTETEHKIYETLVQTLSHTTIVSVAHRKSLDVFHTHFLEIKSFTEARSSDD